MSGVFEFSSSKFEISQSEAKFINGLFVENGVESSVSVNGIFSGDGSTLTGVQGASGITMFVGSASGNPPQFDEWVTGEGGTHSVRIEASASGGQLNHFTFIENKNGDWFIVSSGSNNGLVEKNFYETEELDTGTYRYLVDGHSTESKVTVVKGTTVTINPGEL